MSEEKDKVVRIERVEILPPEPTHPATTFDALVQQKVAEALARREDATFQPYFQSRRVAQEIRKMQSVPEQRAWAVHYERYSCTHCRTTKRPHGSCGMCSSCYAKISNQKREIEKELSTGGER